MAVPITCARCEWVGLLCFLETGTYLSYIRSDDGHLGQDIEGVVEPPGQEGTTCLGEVEPADGAELDGQALEEDGKYVAQKHDKQQPEAVRRPGRNVGCVVPRIDFK